MQIQANLPSLQCCIHRRHRHHHHYHYPLILLFGAFSLERTEKIKTKRNNNNNNIENRRWSVSEMQQTELSEIEIIIIICNNRNLSIITWPHDTQQYTFNFIVVISFVSCFSLIIFIYTYSSPHFTFLSSLALYLLLVWFRFLFARLTDATAMSDVHTTEKKTDILLSILSIDSEWRRRRRRRRRRRWLHDDGVE